MESLYNYHLYDRRPICRSKAPPVKWFREWVPQDVVATGEKCMLLKWVTEDTLMALKEKAKEPEAPEPEPEPTTEVLFLCSYDGCGRTFFDASALRKHSHIHGERQCVCHYEGCGKKFLDSSKLKRHFLIHTGERDYACPHEGCGKAFSLDFNLRSHMKTHSRENYLICPYRDCGKRYAHEYKLKNHITSHREKFVAVEVTRYAPPTEKPSKVGKTPTSVYGSASPDRPFACPYEWCEKAYIHEYKLKLHLRREHPDHMSYENADMDEGSDQDARGGKRFKGKSQKQSKHRENLKLPPSKITPKASSPFPATTNVMKKPWRVKEDAYEEEKGNKVEDGWRFAENNEDDNEETEYED